MSQLDRAFIRAYTSETPSRSPDAAAQTSDAAMNNPQTTQSKPSAPIRTMSRKPTLSELQHWKNQGIRIDMPGSPLVGSYEEAAAKEGLDDTPMQDEFALAAQNTAAVAEALDRLMARAGRKHTPVHPVSASKAPQELKSELPPPTIEIDDWEPEAVANLEAESDDDAGFIFVAAIPTSQAMAASILPTFPSETHETPANNIYRQRVITQPKWEAEAICWPEETDMILELCGDEWNAMAASISETIKSLAVVSLGEGCGCTTLTICLAKLLAQHNRRVLIIDEGEGQGSLTVRIGLAEGCPPQSGKPLETLYEAMIQTTELPIAILPAGYRQLGDLTANQLHQFTRDFDVVLWDGGDRPEVWQRLAMIHSVLLVRDARGTHDHELGQILPKLEERKINVIGIADNFWR